MVSAASPLVQQKASAQPQARPAPSPGHRKNYYARHTRQLKRELAEMLPMQELRRLHRVSTGRHLWLAARQFALMALAGWGSIAIANPLIWLPLAVLQGWVIFNFTVMLHEVVHENALRGKHPFLNRMLGLLYAIPSGISASQFTRWHLDHHDSLGSDDEDPKRHHLSPKRNVRWYKLLYFTPALIPIYFRAAGKETATYQKSLRRTIRNERLLTIGIHLAALSALLYLFGWYALTRAYLVPYLFVFPVAFALNRLAQHYHIVPEDPAQWSTLMKRSRFWDIAYLWSSYHLEHHYFPRVPFYNLVKLRRLLRPFFEQRGMQAHGYGELLYDYIVRNKAPHTNWSIDLD